MSEHGWTAPIVKVTITRVSDDAHKFLGRLSAAGNVPLFDTATTCNAQFWLIYHETELRFKLKVHDIDNVVAAHIHAGLPNENGPVVACNHSELCI